MRKLPMLVLIGVLAVGLMSAAIPAEQSPATAVVDFVKAWNEKNLKRVAELTVGANPARDYSALIKMSEQWPILSYKNLKVETVGKIAHGSADFEIRAGTQIQRITDKFDLQQVGTVWKVVPNSGNKPGATEQVLGMLSSIVADPKIADPRGAANQTKCLTNAKQLGTAAQILAVDNDEVLKIKPGYAKAALAPYIKSAALWKCPDDSSSASYRINERLIGKRLDGIAAPDKTVLLYVGDKGKLHFRHNGRAAVAFVDGHAKLVTPEQAKSLRWSP